jgi:hypothetical protein
MESDRYVQFDAVEILEVDDFVVLCQVRRRRMWLGVGRLQAGTTIARRGDRGVLVLEREFALERQLITAPSPAVARDGRRVLPGG